MGTTDAEHVSGRPTMTQEEYARSRDSVWVGAAVLFTDALGRVLLVQPTYKPHWLLPGGGAERGESPHAAAGREAAEELGLNRAPGRLLASQYVPPDHPSIAPDLPFPGEIRHVYDGGTLTEQDLADLRLPPHELADYALLDAAEAAQRMTPVYAALMLAALRARLSATTAHLCGSNHTGQVPPLDHHQVLPRLRSGHSWPWRTTPVPDGMRIMQAWGWLFAPDGRVVIVVDPQKRWPMLPGGTVEPTDVSPEDTLRREATEEAQVTVGGDITRLGWIHDATGEVYGGIGECARLRLAAPLTTVGPAAVDPATGRQFARLLTTPQQAAGLLGWGQQGHTQAELAAEIAHERWGIPYAAPSPITELRESRGRR